jgi:hypothetical protein
MVRLSSTGTCIILIKKARHPGTRLNRHEQFVSIGISHVGREPGP